MDELEEMKAQMALLKAKLDDQAIISDHLLREVTRQKVRRLNRNVWQEGIAALFVCTFGNYAFHQMGLSNWFLLGTTLMMIVCVAVTVISHNRVNMQEIMAGDLLTVSKQVRNLKKVYQNWLKLSWPIIIIWLGWFVWELYSAIGDSKIFIGMSCGCLVGAFIGGAIGLHMHNRLVKEMDDIVADIEKE